MKGARRADLGEPRSELTNEGRRRKLFAVVAAAVGVTLALVLLEFIVRVVSPPWLDRRMTELRAGGVVISGSDQGLPVIIEGRTFRQFIPGSHFELGHGEYHHWVTIDELGGRSTPHRLGDPTLLPIMGDSFTFGVGVEDQETFVSLLAGRTEQRLVNLGVSGTALHNQLDTLLLRHEELGRPRHYVFVVFMGNDLTNIRRRYEPSAVDGSAQSARRDQRWLLKANLAIFRHPVLKRSYAIQFVRQRLLTVMVRSNRTFMSPVFQAMRVDKAYLDDCMVYFRRELERLEKVSARLGFAVDLVLIPDVHQIDAARRADKARSLGLNPAQLDPDRISKAVSAALNDYGFEFMNISHCLSATGVEGLYYMQDTHFTAAGQAAAAECMVESGLMESLTRGAKDWAHGSLADDAG